MDNATKTDKNNYVVKTKALKLGETFSQREKMNKSK